MWAAERRMPVFVASLSVASSDRTLVVVVVAAAAAAAAAAVQGRSAGLRWPNWPGPLELVVPAVGLGDAPVAVLAAAFDVERGIVLLAAVPVAGRGDEGRLGQAKVFDGAAATGRNARGWNYLAVEIA